MFHWDSFVHCYHTFFQTYHSPLLQNKPVLSSTPFNIYMPYPQHPLSKKESSKWYQFTFGTSHVISWIYLLSAFTVAAAYHQLLAVVNISVQLSSFHSFLKALRLHKFATVYLASPLTCSLDIRSRWEPPEVLLVLFLGKSQSEDFSIHPTWSLTQQRRSGLQFNSIWLLDANLPSPEWLIPSSAENCLV